MKQYIEERFREYTDAYDASDVKIKLKIDHTYRVAALCERIACSLDLAKEDVLLAWICGMLHDIGRFEQVKRYGTFIDSESVDHATFGADLLFLEGLYEQIIPDQYPPGEKALIEKAIRAHNRFRIPEGLSEREQLFARILRDADKIDILRVNYETPIEEIYNTTIEDFKKADVSEDVKQAFRERRCAKRHDKTTSIDHLVGHVCLIFELEFPESLKIVREQGYVWKLLEFASDNPKTEEWFSYMRSEMRDYVN